LQRKYLATLGGGLGDAFIKLYHHSQYQILPMIADRLDIDCLMTCCNPAIKSIVPSLLTSNDNPVFRDVFYRDLFFTQTDEGKDWILEYRNKGYIFLDDEQGWQSLFHVFGIDNPFQYGYFHGTLYRHRYALTYQEQEFFYNLQHKYIVIHPSGGLQAIDGLTREEYSTLIELLLDTFPEYTFVAIGASHKRADMDCSDCDNYATINKDCHKVERLCVRFKEESFDIHHERFIDLTNKTSGALCANIVENADAFIGSHSAWMNLFWHFNKPTICVLSNDTAWGNAESYVKTNGCKWGFALPHSVVVPVINSIGEVYNNVIMELRWRLYAKHSI
jgi:hypothetical protein